MTSIYHQLNINPANFTILPFWRAFW